MNLYQLLFSIVCASLTFFAAHVFYDKFFYTEELTATSFPLEDTIIEVKQELVKLANTPGTPLGLRLDEVEIILMVDTVITDSNVNKLKVPVFKESAIKANSFISHKSASKISLVLVPPDGSQTLSTTEKKQQFNFSELLIHTRKSLELAIQEEPPLEAKSIEVEINFIFSRNQDVGATIDVQVLSVGAERSGQDSTSNSIKFTYVNPRYQSSKDALPIIPP